MPDFARKTLKINYCDWSYDYYNAIPFGGWNLEELLGHDYNLVVSGEPDFLFCSSYGAEFTRFTGCVKILFYAENIVPDFNYYDYAIGFNNLSFCGRHLYIPYYAFFLDMPLLEKVNADNSLSGRKFCNFMYYNSSVGGGAATRQEFCKKLMEYKHIDCPGRVLNNMARTADSRHMGDWWAEKIEFLKNYKFTIAFENDMQIGYTTEKLYHPFMAGSVPIYWGNPEASTDFNPRAFINCNDYGNDFDRVINRVKELDNDDDLYMRMLSENPLNEPGHENSGEKIREFLCGVFIRGNRPFCKDEGKWSVTDKILANKYRENGLLTGLRSTEDHRRFCKEAKNSGMKLVTFGLTETSATIRKLDFINDKNVTANFDNKTAEPGKGLWGIDNLSPALLPEYVKKNGTERIIIMADAIAPIGRQLDSMGLKYYSSIELGNVLMTGFQFAGRRWTSREEISADGI